MKPYYQDSAVTIYHGDCREILTGNSYADLVVTSPKYNCGMDYDLAADDLSWNEYWKETDEWLRVMPFVLSDAGRLAVNLPWWMGSKPRRDVPYAFQTCATELGLTKLDKIIWVKGNEQNVHTSGGYSGGGCGWGTYLSPSGPSIRCASEPILIFSNGDRGRGAVSGEGRGKCIPGDITEKEWLDWTIDVWFIRGASDTEHPAVFPVEVPWRLIKLYTFPGETVLDPFMGSGTTLRAAKDLGRKAIGIEISERYCEIAAKRMAQEVLNLAA